MDFQIPGPLAVDDLALGGVRQRAVLAVLLLHANEAVSADRLVAALWGEETPPTALKALQVAVSRLRRELGSADVVEDARGRLPRSRGAGRARPRSLRARGGSGARVARRRARGTPPPEQLREALAEWRGPPLADLIGDAVRGRRRSRAWTSSAPSGRSRGSRRALFRRRGSSARGAGRT